MAPRFVDLAMRTRREPWHYSPELRAPPSDRLVQNYHRFMIVTADSEDMTRRWVYWTLTDVLIGKLVRQTHSLWLMLHRLSIHDRVLELLHDSLVNSIALICCQYRPMNETAPPTKSSTLQAFFLSTTGVL